MRPAEVSEESKLRVIWAELSGAFERTDVFNRIKNQQLAGSLRTKEVECDRLRDANAVINETLEAVQERLRSVQDDVVRLEEFKEQGLSSTKLFGTLSGYAPYRPSFRSYAPVPNSVPYITVRKTERRTNDHTLRHSSLKRCGTAPIFEPNRTAFRTSMAWSTARSTPRRSLFHAVKNGQWHGTEYRSVRHRKFVILDYPYAFSIPKGGCIEFGTRESTLSGRGSC